MKLLSSLLLTIILLSFYSTTPAQNTFPPTGSAGIGTTSPAASAALEIKSTNLGLLILRISKNQCDSIVRPALGLMIYQTNNTPVFCYNSGSAWIAVAGTKRANTSLSNLVAPTSISRDLLPAADNIYNLGGNTKDGEICT